MYAFMYASMVSLYSSLSIYILTSFSTCYTIYNTLYTAINIPFSLMMASSLSLKTFTFNMDTTVWGGLTYCIIFATFFNFNAYAWVNQRVSPSMTTAAETFQPVVTCYFSFALLNTPVTQTELEGGLLVILGIVFLTKGRQIELEEYGESGLSLKPTKSDGYIKDDGHITPQEANP